MGQGDQLYTIKVIASEEENNIFILGTAAIDATSGRTVNQEIVAASSSSILNINIRATHKDFLNKIQNVVYTGKQLKNITKNLQDNFKKSFSSEGFVEELIHYSDTQDSAKMSYLFEQIFAKACGVGNYKVQVASSQISGSELDSTSITINAESVPSGEGEAVGEVTMDAGQGMTPTVSDIPPGAKVVQFKFLLSPVTGTAVTNLFPGSPIVVRLNQSDPASKDTIESLNLRGEDGVIKPLPGSIHKITHRGNESDIIVKFSDNLYGKYTEEENSVKVRTSMAESKSRVVQNNSQNIEKNIEALKNDSSLFFYIMAIAALIAIAIFVLIFLA
jgi:hypothetical protein